MDRKKGKLFLYFSRKSKIYCRLPEEEKQVMDMTLDIL